MNNEQTPELQGKTITDENGVRYFVMGNTRTRITEYFKENGPTLTEAVEELILYKAREKMRKKQNNALCSSEKRV